MTKNKFKHRFLARIVIEAKTPLAVGSGEKDIMTDALVATDVNGLPYIPGTSIAGVLRHAIGEERAKQFFGFQSKDSKESKGSEIIFSSAQMVGKDGWVIDGLQNINFSDEFYSKFKTLPIRQHCRIDSSGTAADGGKFDEQVVYKGTRFCFEIEMVSDGTNFSQFEDVLKKVHSNTLRVGGGTRSGFGEIGVIECKTAKIDFKQERELTAYLDKSSNLSDTSFWNKEFVETFPKTDENDSDNYTKYELKLKPDDFFLFGSGLGNEQADNTPVTEVFVKWDSDGKPKFTEQVVLIPASSVKGAISHRVAFHYNKLKGIFADTISNPEDYV
jgi:CRISPR/Cas system CSM-associated protein Csm3 (group 7 of RAMP superfamily)